MAGERFKRNLKIYFVVGYRTLLGAKLSKSNTMQRYPVGPALRLEQWLI
jgi:hypothetical protein